MRHWGLRALITKWTALAEQFFRSRRRGTNPRRAKRETATRIGNSRPFAKNPTRPNGGPTTTEPADETDTGNVTVQRGATDRLDRIPLESISNASKNAEAAFVLVPASASPEHQERRNTSPTGSDSGSLAVDAKAAIPLGTAAAVNDGKQAVANTSQEAKGQAERDTEQNAVQVEAELERITRDKSRAKKNDPEASKERKLAAHQVRTEAPKQQWPPRTVEPPHRGGVRGVEHEQLSSRDETRWARNNLEVVCKRRNRCWTVAIHPSDNAVESPTELWQEGKQLRRSDYEDTPFPITSINDPVYVKFESAFPTEIRVGMDGYVLFKIARDGFGRKVSLATAGDYIAVVPKSWERDEKSSGPAPVEHEQTSVPGYHAHHFKLRPEDRKPIVFHTLEGDVCVSDGNGFQLVGKTCPDASDWGPLFIGAPPRLSVENPVLWKQLDNVVLGEEGLGRGKWRTDFLPHPIGCELSLPQELADRRIGWFFIRLYDKRDQLLDSFDFRFASSFRGIGFRNPCPMLPPASGHQPVEILIDHGHEMHFSPRDGDDAARKIRAVLEDGQTQITVPPDREFDASGWTLRHEGRSLELMLKLPRIRWALGTQQLPTEWTDRPLQLSLDDCDVLSDRRLWIYWPIGNDELHEIDVGFSRGSWRTIVRRRDDQRSSLELREFCNAPERQKCGRVQMSAWLVSGDESAIVAELHTVLACTLCDFICNDRGAMFDHVAAKHGDTYFRRLTYEETRDSLPDEGLPAYIHKCGHCPFIAEARDGEDPTGSITHHMTVDCRANKKPNGDRDKSFWRITQVEDVRAHTKFKHLPDITICTLCKSELQPDTPEERREHLIRCHDKKVYTRRNVEELNGPNRIGP